MAIAHAVMQHLVETVNCKTLFITHYPLVATEIARQFADVQNAHMGYVENERPGAFRDTCNPSITRRV